MIEINRHVKAWSTRLGPGRAGLVLAMLWAIMTLWNFELPGLQMDEANHYAFIPGITSDSAARLHHFRLPDNYLDGQDNLRRFPILGGSFYNSPVIAYLGLPYFAIAGHSVASLRIFSALIGLATILSVALLVGRIFDWPAALLAGTIIATDPTHVFSIRSQGISLWPAVLFWALAANFLLTAVRDQRTSAWPVIAGGACLGWSVMSYFVGIFLALPLVFTALVVLRKRPVHLALFVLAGLLAYSPVIYALISINTHSPELLRSFGIPDWAARESVAVFSSENLTRLQTITVGAFGAHDFVTWITGKVAVEFTVPRIFAFGLATGLLLVLAFLHRDTPTSRRVFYWLSGATLALYFSALFILKATSLHHLLPITMLAAAVCGGAITARGLVRPLVFALCGLLVATNLVFLNSAHKRLIDTGGRGYHNENYSLIAPLLAGPLAGYHPVFTGWGFHLQFLFLTDGRVPYTFMGAPQNEQINELLNRHGRLAIVVPVVDRARVEEAFTHQHELRFAQRNGVELFSLFLLSIEQD